MLEQVGGNETTTIPVSGTRHEAALGFRLQPVGGHRTADASAPHADALRFEHFAQARAIVGLAAHAKLTGQRGDAACVLFQQADLLLSESGVILRKAHSVLGWFYRSVHGTRFLVQVGFRVRFFDTSS